MKAKLKNIEIVISIDDAKQLKQEIKGMIEQVKKDAEALGAGIDYAFFLESNPKINEFLGVLGLSDESDMPF
jgi:hypothetical protein